MRPRVESILLVAVAVVALSGCGSGDHGDAAKPARGFPEPRTRVPDLRPTLAAWAQSREWHTLKAPATDDELDAVESQLGRKFPPAFRAVYEISNGGSFLDGNLMLDPLRGRFSVATESEQMRASSESVPPEVVVFGGDGSDTLFGLWLPKGRDADAPAPVVQLDIEGEPLALVGTDFARFLKSWTAYYLIVLEANDDALDALGVPRRLRISPYDADEKLFFALREWADPELPDPRADPYERPTSVNDLRRRFGGDA